MRKILITLIVCLFVPALLIANSGNIYTNKQKKDNNEVTLIKSDKSEIILKVEVNAYSVSRVKINGVDKYIINTPDGTRLLEAGAPDLPKFTESLIIPDKAGMKVEVSSTSYIEVEDIDILPSKGNFTRDIVPSSIPYQYGEVYSNNAFYPSDIATLRDPYILRDYRGQTVVFTPFHYNPVSKTLRIYTEFEVKITEDNIKSVNVFDRSGINRKLVGEFDNVYRSHFVNYPELRYTPIAEDGEMLIICHPTFLEAMEPFEAWKIQKGIKTTMISSTTIGTTSTAIKSYISTFYNANNLSYVLLVGDANLVPTVSASAGDSDNSYGYLTGNDSYPEVFVGRFSAETVPHVNTMVERTLMYEWTPTISAAYGNSVSIGSNQGPGDDNEMDYDHLRNMQTDLNAFTYTDAAEFFDGSQGGLDASGNPSATSVGTEINAGAGVIVYTGHGSTTAFSSSGFSNSNVGNLTNTGVHPFIWSVACVNGNFVNNTCFAEAWLRAENNNSPTGAIATLMSTINQSWNPPMCGQDEMVDILVESYSNNIKRSFGGLSLNGCMQMNDEYGAGGASMTDTWNLFGDPSVIVRTTTPTALVVSHASTTFIGSNQFQVNCTTEGAIVALTIGSEILGTGIVTGGIANITFPILNTVGTITVTVTAFNKIPYVGSVDVVPNNGPYVIYSSMVIQDPTGNNNQIADFSELIDLDIELSNVGIENAIGVNGILSSTDPYVTINTASYAFGNVDSSSTQTFTSAFSITVADDIPDQHVCSFVLDLTDNLNNTWSSGFSVTLNAPVIGLQFDGIDDSGQIVNGRLDAGESVNLLLSCDNIGHASSPVATCTISSSSQFITVNNSSVTVGTIDLTAPISIVSNISIDANTPIGTVVDFNFNLEAGAYTQSFSINKTVGLIVEDWESNDFLTFGWSNDLSFPWIVNSTSPYEGSFTAQSGTITHNQVSVLTLQIETLTADTLSFFKRVSSEEPGSWGIYDYLEFKINNSVEGEWGGEIDWSREAYYLPAGSHTLTWTYIKDGNVSDGEDCAWVDFVVLPPLDMNYAPYFVSTQDTIEAEANSQFSQLLECNDMNVGDNLVMGLNNLPTWMTFTDNGNWTGDLSGMPSTLDLGEFELSAWVYDGNADTVSYDFILKVVPPLNIHDIYNDLSIEVYPNPIVDIATLSINLENSCKANISLYNLIGEEVGLIYTNSLLPSGNSSIEFDTKGLENGVYFVKFDSENIKIQKKIIITH